jgi:hypothetical protein
VKLFQDDDFEPFPSPSNRIGVAGEVEVNGASAPVSESHAVADNTPAESFDLKHGPEGPSGWASASPAFDWTATVRGDVVPGRAMAA